MPTFIADPSQGLYLVLAALLVITGAVAAQKQGRRATVAFGVAFLLVLLVFVIDKTNESPREEAVRRVHMLAASADAKNPDAFGEHVADKVTVYTAEAQQGKEFTRDELKKHPFWGALQAHKVTVSVADFSREDVTVIDGNTVEIGFLGKGTPQGLPTIPVYMRAAFAKQPDGSRKLTALKAYHHLERKNLASVPNFP